MSLKRITCTCLALFVTTLALAAETPGPKAVTVFAATSLTNVLQQLGKEFTAATGVPVRFSFAASSVLARQIEAGAGADVFFSADQEWMDYLEQRGLIQKSTRRNVVGNRLALIAPTDSTLDLKIEPGFAIVAALGAGRLATADPDSVPVGRYAKQALTTLGVWPDLADRLVRAEDVRHALMFVARGEVPLGIVYATDAKVEKRVRVVDIFPASTHTPITYPMALLSNANPAATRFAEFVRGDVARAAFESFGFVAPALKELQRWIFDRVAALVCTLLMAGTLAVTTANAATNDAVTKQIESLRQMVERQQAQLDAQRQQLDAQRAELDVLKGKEASAAAGAAAGPTNADAKRIDALEQQVAQAKIAAQEAPGTKFSNGRLTETTADGRSSIAVRANVQLDAGHYDQDSPGTLATDFRRGSVGAGSRENDAARDLSDGAYFRRARFGVEGVIARDFNYRFLAEFGGSGTEGAGRINDAYIAYTGFAPLTFQIGAFSPPANMADGIATEDLLFIERATPAELSRSLGGADGRLGFGVRSGGPRWMGALTYTSRTVGDAETFDSQRALVGRLGGLVLANPDYNVHLGVNGTYVISAAQSALSGASQYGLRFRDRPELRVDSTRLIDTGNIEADGGYAAGIEFAANWKSFLLQGENYWYGVERRISNLPDPDFSGYYVEASWIPTGETRRYVSANGAFQGPRPRVPFDGKGGWGAWELALRYSNMDLNFREGLDGTAAPADSVRGGDQSVLAAGINWYLNGNIKFMLDYMHVEVDRLNPASATNPTPFGTSPATPPFGVQIGQDLNIYALRSQFSF